MRGWPSEPALHEPRAPSARLHLCQIAHLKCPSRCPALSVCSSAFIPAASNAPPGSPVAVLVCTSLCAVPLCSYVELFVDDMITPAATWQMSGAAQDFSLGSGLSAGTHTFMFVK